MKTAKRYLRSLGVQHFESYIGFRADEAHRVSNYKSQAKKVIAKFPLVDMGVNKEMVDQYWLTRPYNLEVPRILGNCDLCFLKGKDAIIKILQQFPELADKWIKAEDDAAFFKKKNASRFKNAIGGTFIKDITYRQMLHVAQSQKTLFDLDIAEPAFNCSCTS